MRARFTAHVLHRFEFLHCSYLPTSVTPYVEEKDPPSVNWTRLVIHSHEPGPKADVAYVDFSAYHDDGTEHAGAHHEKAEFMLRHGGWIYSRPVREGAAPIRLAQPKPGRNDPCPCGSGKKYKHCCLNRPEVRKIAG